jgi:hypothetical protein
MLAQHLLPEHRTELTEAIAGGTDQQVRLGPIRSVEPIVTLAALPESGDRRALRDRGAGAGVPPEFMAKRDSELIVIRGSAPTTPSVPRLAVSATVR